MKEIKSIVEKISKKGKKIFVVGNNHYKGQAVVNLLQIRSVVEGKKILMPEGITKTYGTKA